jgi:hypothetical protein|tara:strand:- start:1111 stop:1821 length:711 start_codon:yes stop_codon:yes gene_type:complete
VNTEEIKKLVKTHVDITDKELDDLDRETNFEGVLTKRKPKTIITKYNTTDNINEYGYRSDSFDDDTDGFMFLGCSLTAGVGLEEHETWPWMVGKHFDVRVWNLSQNGRGDDLCFMNAVRWIPKLKPKVVSVLLPTAGRFQFFDYDNDKLSNEFYIYNLPKKPKFPWLYNSKHLYLSVLKNVMGIKLICDEYNIPFIVESSTEILDWPDKARDDSHPGPKWQKIVSNLYIESIERFF